MNEARWAAMPLQRRQPSAQRTARRAVAAVQERTRGQEVAAEEGSPPPPISQGTRPLREGRPARCARRRGPRARAEDARPAALAQAMGRRPRERAWVTTHAAPGAPEPRVLRERGPTAGAAGVRVREGGGRARVWTRGRRRKPPTLGGGGACSTPTPPGRPALAVGAGRPGGAVQGRPCSASGGRGGGAPGAGGELSPPPP